MCEPARCLLLRAIDANECIEDSSREKGDDEDEDEDCGWCSSCHVAGAIYDRRWALGVILIPTSTVCIEASTTSQSQGGQTEFDCRTSHLNLSWFLPWFLFWCCNCSSRSSRSSPVSSHRFPPSHPFPAIFTPPPRLHAASSSSMHQPPVHRSTYRFVPSSMPTT
jgi:hypothetical protein